MEILNTLTKITKKSTKRLGRGLGSAVGRTSGRGSKGDKARGKTGLAFDGTKIKKGWIKRLPFLRGKHRLNKQYLNLTIQLDQIASWFKEGETVDLNAIAKKANLSMVEMKQTVKILSAKEFNTALTFKGLSFSDKARKQILSANGKIEG